MAYRSMSDGASLSSAKKEQEEVKKQLQDKASDKSAKVSAQAAQGDSPQVAMQKAAVTKQLQKQQQSSQSNMPSNKGGGGGPNTMSRISAGVNSPGNDKDASVKSSTLQKTLEAGKATGGDPMSMATAAVVGALEEGKEIRDKRIELEKSAKEEEAKGLSNVGDIWTSLAGQMKGLLR